MEAFKVGTVINFDNRETFFGNAIGRFTQSKWTHSGLVYKHSDKSVWIAEAVSNGYKVNKYSRKELIDRWEKNTLQLRVSIRKLSAVRDNCDNYLNIKYGRLQLFKIAILILVKKRLKADGLKTLICSEGVSRVLYDSSGKFINIAHEFGCDYDYVTPKMLSTSTLLETLHYWEFYHVN